MSATSPALERWLEHMPGLHDQKSHGRRGVKGKLKAAARAVDDFADLHEQQRSMLAGMDPDRQAKLAADFRAHNAKRAQLDANRSTVSSGVGDLDDSVFGLAPDVPAKPSRSAPSSTSGGKVGAALAAAPVHLGDDDFERGGDDLDEADVEAMLEYRDGRYEDFNEYKRALGRGADPDDIDPDGSFAEQSARMSAVFGQSKLTEPVTVYRGVGEIEQMLGGIDTNRSLVGLEYVEDAPASTTVDRRVSGAFGDSGVVLNITVPAGTGAVQLSKHYDGEMNAIGRPTVNDNAASVHDLVGVRDYEAELLLQDGLRYRITGDRTVDGRRELDVEVVG